MAQISAQQLGNRQQQNGIQSITLKGSAEIVAEFFAYAVNRRALTHPAAAFLFSPELIGMGGMQHSLDARSILYQRAIYPPEQFEHIRKYGMNMLVTSDAALREYLDSVMEQIKQWLAGGDLQRLVLVATNARTEEVTERWQFEVETDTEIGRDGSVQKSEKEINSEIAAIIRQITASVTFLPLITDPCTFDLLVYTAAEADVPASWEESDPRYVNNSEEMRMRSFTTKVHRVGTSVSYAKTRPDEQ